MKTFKELMAIPSIGILFCIAVMQLAWLLIKRGVY
jgi:hypothetical protein